MHPRLGSRCCRRTFSGGTVDRFVRFGFDASVSFTTWAIRGICCLTLTTVPAWSKLAGAQPSTSSQAPSERAHRLNWTFPRFRLWQYISSATISVSGYVIERSVTMPDGSWNNGILFDSPLRSWLAADTVDGRANAARISDRIWYATQYFPVLDSIIVPLASDRLNVDVAAQLTLVNWQVIGLSFILTRTAHWTVGRARPSLQECANNPNYDGYCDVQSSGRNASFLSGHTSMSFASAGLTCSHHAALPLYGGGLPDYGICGLSLASATTVGILRIVADRHWTTDVLSGAVLGSAIGFGIPYFLHYKDGAPRSLTGGLLPPSMAIVPMVGPGQTGAMLVGFQ